MSSFKQIQIFKQPKPGQILSDSALYWKDYEFPTVINEYGGINHICASQVKPFYVAATHASRVHIYDSSTKTSIKSFSFSENAYSANFRDDGKLMCIGFESNCAKVYPLLEDQKMDQFDADESVTTTSKPTKRPLRKFEDHLGPVHVCRFMRNMYHVMTASDDAHLRIFDLATSSTLTKLKAHKDYIRSGCTSKSSDDLILTGSYDHTVKMVDTRINSVVCSVDHGEPIENILMFPSSNMFVSCGGNSIKVWDVLKGGLLMKTIVNHHKTVTSLAFSHNHKYLLSGGLDRHVKIFDLISYDLVHTIDYPSAVLSLDILPEDKSLIVGMADGLLSIRDKRKHDVNSEAYRESFKHSHKSTEYNPYKYASPYLFNISPNYHVISNATKIQLKNYDKNLKNSTQPKLWNRLSNTKFESKHRK
jgi:U3 small nucleolar RNA-associated protein 15